MPGFLVRLVVNAIAIWVATLFVGIQVAGAGGIVLTALTLALVNALIRPIIICLTLPLNLITLGLFTLVINALMFWLALWLASLAGAAAAPGFGAAFLGALIVSIVSWLLSFFVR